MLDDGGWALARQEVQVLLRKLFDAGLPLEDYVNKKIYRGILTGLNEAFVIDEATRNRLLAEDANSAEIIKPFLAGRDIKRYAEPVVERYVILIPSGWTEENMGIGSDPWAFIQDTYPAIANYLEPFRDKAEKRWDKGDYWWELRPCAYYDEFEKSKIIYPNICSRPEFTLESDRQFTNQKCYIIASDDKYLLGILNSRIMMFYFQTTIPKLRGDYYEPGYAFMKSFPIRTIDFDNPDDVQMHNKMVELVDTMLELHRQLQGSVLIRREVLEMQIEATDKEIDALVYRLYGLTDGEIKIVAGG